MFLLKLLSAERHLSLNGSFCKRPENINDKWRSRQNWQVIALSRLSTTLWILDSRYWISDSLPVELGFRISIVSGIPDFLSWIRDSQVQDFQFYKNKFYGWIWIPQAKFPRFRKSNYLTWVMCTLNALSLLGEFSCKYHALKGFDHKIWLKFTSFSIKYLLEEFLMCSFVRWGFLKRL